MYNNGTLTPAVKPNIQINIDNKMINTFTIITWYKSNINTDIDKYSLKKYI